MILFSHCVMFILSYKCLFIYAVLDNIKLSKQIYLNNKLIGHDILLRNGRRHNNFDYNFNDWDDNSTQNILLDYNLDVTLKDDNLGQFHNYDVQTHYAGASNASIADADTTQPASNGHAETGATPIIDTTELASNGESETTTILFITVSPTEAQHNTTTQVPVVEITTDVDSNQTIPTDFNEVNDTTVSTNPEAEEAGSESVELSTNVTLTTAITLDQTTTTEIVITFPSSHPTESQYPSIAPPDIGVHYPADMTFPDFRPTQGTNGISELFTRQTTTISTTEGAVVKEAHHEMQEKKAGYLTTFLLEVFKIMAIKNTTDASRLFQALESEVNRMESMRQLSGFGKSTVASFLTLVRTLNGIPPDVVQSQAALGNYLLTNRTITLPADVVALLDLADEMYTPQEGERIIAVLQEINDFPETLKTELAIAREVMEAVVMTPFKRMYGTPREKYLVQRLEEVVVNKFFNGLPAERRQGVPMLRTVFIRYNKTKKIRTRPTPLRESTSTMSTPLPKKYAIFSKNKTIYESFHDRMWRYMNRRDRKQKKWNRWKRKHRIVAGIEIPKVNRSLKSIYVIRKYVRKNLKRRKIKTTPFQDDFEEHQLIEVNLDKKEATKGTKLKSNAKIKLKTRNKKKRNQQIKRKIKPPIQSNGDKMTIRTTQFQDDFNEHQLIEVNLDEIETTKGTKIKSNSMTKLTARNKKTRNQEIKRKIKPPIQSNDDKITTRTTQSQDDFKEHQLIEINLDKVETTKRMKLRTNAMRNLTTHEKKMRNQGIRVKMIPPESNSGKIIKKYWKNTRNKKRRKFSSNDNYRNNNDYSKNTRRNNVLLKRTDLKVQRFKAANYRKDQSSITDEEDTLKANLDDAFFHSRNEPILRNGNSQSERHVKPKHNHEISSYSDEETVLKSKIYKAFGYENDFAEAVKRRRQTN